MNQVEEIRRLQKINYLKKTWLPNITKKYTKYFSPENIAARRICKFMKKHLLPEVINLSQEQLDYIPGLFKIRFKFNETNLEMPIKVKKSEPVNDFYKYEFTSYDCKNNSNYESQISNYLNKQNNIYSHIKHEQNNDFNIKSQDDYDLAIKQSLMNYNDNYENEVETVIQLSLDSYDNHFNDNHFNDKNVNQNDNIYKEDILDLSEESQMDLAVMESMKTGKFNENLDIDDELQKALDFSLGKNIIKLDDQGFYICLDLRIYGPDPYKEIYIGDKIYYLNENQIKKIKNAWARVNPDSSAGIIYSQNIEYYKSFPDSFKKK